MPSQMTVAATCTPVTVTCLDVRTKGSFLARRRQTTLVSVLVQGRRSLAEMINNQQMHTPMRPTLYAQSDILALCLPPRLVALANSLSISTWKK